MRDELFTYYERELRFIRRMAADFARRYPAVAGQLLLEPDKCDDPHVERIIEAFAMLTARVQLKLDDEFPQITDAFLGVLYPHYLAPIPSATVVQFTMDPEQAGAARGIRIQRHSILHSRPIKAGSDAGATEGLRCRFRTCYPLTLWPLEVTAVDVVPIKQGEPACPPEARAAVRIRLRTLGGKSFAELGVDALTFFVDGDPPIAHSLYETLFRAPLGVVLRFGAQAGGRELASVFLEREHLRPVGFEKDEGLIEYPPGASIGYRTLQEYFSFADKFMFAEISGLERGAAAGLGDVLDILVLLDQPAMELVGKFRPENLKLGCTPAVNLFPYHADPIRLEHTSVEYAVVPDQRSPLAYEVHSITEVSSTMQDTGEAKTYRPFYDLRHGDPAGEEVAYWYAERHPSMRRNDAGTDVAITLVDRAARPADQTPGDVLHVTALCTNRDLPALLTFGEARDFQLEGQAGLGIRCLRKPTLALRSPQQREGRWRLVSHLSLNFLSIADGGGEAQDLDSGDVAPEVLQAFREILKLYDFADSAVTQQRITGLVGVRARRVLRRISYERRSGGSLRRRPETYARGLEVRLDFDEDRYAGTGVFLFACVLERFLGLYTSINSFTQTEAHVRQREGVLKRWPPRAGEMLLL